MKLETMLWLMPAVFMLHDLEEIIFLPSWLQENRERIARRSPKFLRRFLSHFNNLSAAAFALAVAEEFVLLVAFTFLVVERSWLNAWAGLVIVFSLHIVIHVLQAFVVGKYVPAILTGLLGLFYAVLSVGRLYRENLISWQPVWSSTLIVLPIVIANLAAAHGLASIFDRWMRSRENQ